MRLKPGTFWMWSTMKWRVVCSTASGRSAGAAQRLGDDFERALVFVPGADVGLDLEGFLDGGNLEEWRDDNRLAFGGDQGRGGALGAPPADAGEVFEGGAGFDEDCRELLLLQNRLNFSNASCAFTSINWSYAYCGI